MDVKTTDISKIGLPLVRAQMKESDFEKWCTKHGFVGDIKAAYISLRKKAGLPVSEKK